MIERVPLEKKQENSAESDMEIRPVKASDADAVAALLISVMGWIPDDRIRAFLEWKHKENPFGTSPEWVALANGEVVGYRAFLRWEFLLPNGETRRAVRAVDTVTDPAWQGKGIFRRLTMTGVTALTEKGVHWVFNTPNEQSRPGYLKMGWRDVGRLGVGVRFLSPLGVARALRARVPAEKWSIPCEVGLVAQEAFADTAGVEGLLEKLPPPRGVRTRITPCFLSWRYGFDPLHYRVLYAGTSLEDGLVVFRVRRRGAAREAVVLSVLVPGDDKKTRRTLLRRVAREVEADHLLCLGSRGLSEGFVLVPGLGPFFTWRALANDTMPSLPDWDLGMGDVELF